MNLYMEYPDSDYEDAIARPHFDVDQDNEMEIDEDTDEDYDLEPGQIIEDQPDANNTGFECVVDEQNTLWGVQGQWVETDKGTWERTHRNRMLTQAEAYADVFHCWNGSTVGSG
ncbi:hypothetical protein GGI43DRAFT_427529 [Trichoderma evansii]